MQAPHAAIGVCVRMFALIFLLVCQVSATHALKHPMQTVKDNSLTLFEQLTRIAGAHEALSKPNVRITILPPTDQAFKTFLQDMGISWQYLQQNEALADAILGYHLLLGVTADSADFTATLAAKKGKKKALRVMTAAEPYSVTLKLFNQTGKPLQWLVRDMQGNTAHVTAADLGEGGHKVHVIDRVLYSGAYWPSFKKLFSTMPKGFSTAQAAIAAAGPAAAALVAEGAANTLFLPTDAGFKRGNISLAASAAEVAALLKDHVITGADLSLPGGFKQGAEVASAGGRKLTISYKQEGGVHKASGLKNYAAYVSLAGGSSSKAEVHVIDNVLKPLNAAAAAAAAAAPAAPAAAAAASPSLTPKTITISKPFFTAAFTLPALTNPVVVLSPATIGAGRKLLEKSTGSLGGVNHGGLGAGHGADERDEYDYVQALELNAEEQDVSVAVNSNGDPNVVGAAGSTAIANIYDANRFPVDPTYASGVAEANAALMDDDAGSDGPGQSND